MSEARQTNVDVVADAINQTFSDLDLAGAEFLSTKNCVEMARRILSALEESTLPEAHAKLNGEYIRADLAKPRVKPLVWEIPSCGRGFIAMSLIGRQYAVFDEGDPRWAIGIGGGGYKYTKVETLKAAKAAAQADYERRMLEALE